MPAILIDPNRRVVEEIPDNVAHPEKLIAADAQETWIVPHCIPEHIGFVDPMGLVNSRRMWFFCEVHIWGPMLIFSEGGHPVKCSVNDVRKLVRFVGEKRLP